MNEMAWIDLVRKHIPNATEDECVCILWNLTCFPLCGVKMVEAQIVELAKERKETAE